ncbi:hypothetical protein VTI74DRAFT_6720 [Chaetomium olivicolor]
MRALSLFLALASSAIAKPILDGRGTRSQRIQWGVCDFPSTGTLPIECGNLSVPLDYTSPSSSETLTLALIRSRAPQTQPSKGTILFNFGGPGYGAIQTLNALAELLHYRTGGQHDLIAFDPRGVSKSLRFSCYDTPNDRLIAGYKYPMLAVDASDVALADTWANTQASYNVSFVARDLMQVVEALDEDGLLRFWGFSYGSLLGATVAAMFPDRIDRLVLDGVVNGHNYYHRFGIDVDQLLSADDAFRGVLDACIKAGPAKCALATVNSTAVELEKTLMRLADNFKHAPMAVGDTVINTRFVRELYFIVIKYPSNVAAAAVHINNLLHRRNLTAVVDFYNGLQADIATGDDDALLGIKCGDTIPRASALADVMPDIRHMMRTSKVFGPYLAEIGTMCARWPFEAKERYAGSFKVKTRTPILFVGNTYDPATPAASARNMSVSFEGSVMVEQHGFGHASLSQASACTTKILQAYFVNGTLPKDGTLCEVDALLF